ncbi:MAG: DegT/DnrJ/EryC1/StrS family aminotransferase [Desulfurellales bacterium]|nr:MAG: DegT/DnrJ/EryC1/StrS family aminotransferase [Desulfurellales bacterium]
MACIHNINGRCLLCEREGHGLNSHTPVSSPSLGSLELNYLQECLMNNQLTHGPMTNRFERAFADMLGVQHAVMCSNGTAALHLALLAAGIGAGDEVLVPDLTFVATANAVMYCGAVPILVDIDPETWGISLEDAERKLTSYTRAIIPVHLYGNPVNMTELLSFGEAHKLHVIEDAAEGLGGAWDGQWLGTIGEMGTYSFYGNKVLTTGEGGAVVTNDDRLAELLRLYRGQGQHPSRRYYHQVVGYNYRMTDLQAAVGLGQLYVFNDNLEKRWKIQETYYQHLQVLGGQTIQPWAAPWLFTMVLPEYADRDLMMQELLSHGVDTRPAFIPLHQMPMYEGQDADFPQSCRVSARGISLPTYPELTINEAKEISSLVRAGLVEQRQ